MKKAAKAKESVCAMVERTVAAEMACGLNHEMPLPRKRDFIILAGLRDYAVSGEFDDIGTGLVLFFRKDVGGGTLREWELCSSQREAKAAVKHREGEGWTLIMKTLGPVYLTCNPPESFGV